MNRPQHSPSAANTRRFRLSVNQKLTIWLVLASTITIGLCMYAEHYIDRTMQDIQQPLTGLEAALDADDWQQAQSCCRRAGAIWQQARRFWLGLMNHQDVINIDTALLSLNAYLQQQNTEDCYNQLALLRYYSQAPVVSNVINWSNIF